MSRYASKTEVPVEKSRMEIEATVRRYGADAFTSGWADRRATIQFRCKDRVMRFNLTLPDAGDKAFTHYYRGSSLFARSPESARAEWEQACRQRWRALALLVKAKLEAVDAGIATIEEAFFADIVMPNNKTVYESAREQVALAYQKGSGDMQLLLGAS